MNDEKILVQTYLTMHIAGSACDIAPISIWKFYFQTYLYMHIAGFACDIAPISIWMCNIQTFRTEFWYKENAKIDGNRDMYYEFGELNLFDLETHELSRQTIHVYPSKDWKEEETDVGTFMFSEINGCQFSVIVPWGKVTFCEPLENILVVRLK